ncbi:hypothetical protein AMTRI_Chr07g78110 [Amborella trichopoda]
MSNSIWEKGRSWQDHSSTQMHLKNHLGNGLQVAKLYRSILLTSMIMDVEENKDLSPYVQVQNPSPLWVFICGASTSHHSQRCKLLPFHNELALSKPGILVMMGKSREP